MGRLLNALETVRPASEVDSARCTMQQELLEIVREVSQRGDHQNGDEQAGLRQPDDMSEIHFFDSAVQTPAGDPHDEQEIAHIQALVYSLEHIPESRKSLFGEGSRCLV